LQALQCKIPQTFVKVQKSPQLSCGKELLSENNKAVQNLNTLIITFKLAKETNPRKFQTKGINSRISLQTEIDYQNFLLLFDSQL
jgi:hypothetical protein